MKKLITYSLITASMLAFSGCGGSTPKVIGANKGDVKRTVEYSEIYNKYRKNGEFTFGAPAVTCVTGKPLYGDMYFHIEDNELEVFYHGKEWGGDRNDKIDSKARIVYNLTDEQREILDKYEEVYSTADWEYTSNPRFWVYVKGDGKYDECRARIGDNQLYFDNSSACDVEKKEAAELMANILKSYIVDRNLDNQLWAVKYEGKNKKVYCIYNTDLVDDTVNVNYWDKKVLAKKVKEKEQIIDKLARAYDQKIKTKVDQKDIDLFMKNPYLKKSGKYIITYMFVPNDGQLNNIEFDIEDMYVERYPNKVLTLSYYCDGGVYRCKKEVNKAKQYDFDLLFGEKGFKPDVFDFKVVQSDKNYVGMLQNQHNKLEAKVEKADSKKIDRKAELTKLLAFKTQDLKIDRTDLELKILKAKKDALDAKRAARKAAYAKRKEAYMKKKKVAEAVKRKQEEIERLKQEVGEWLWKRYY